MKKAVLYLFFLAISNLTFAQEELKIFGEFSTDQRLQTNDNNWSWNENRLDLKLEKKIPSKAKFYSNIWLRNIGTPSVNKLYQLYDKNKITPIDIEVREAYVELYGVFTDKLDIKIGKQRIAWGSADRINPTDNFNSYDLEDIWDFGRHKANESIKITYYFENSKIEGIFSPYFKPHNLPLGIWSSALITEPQFPSKFNFNDSLSIAININKINETIYSPSMDIKENSTFGFKFKSTILGLDYSLSYVNGIDGLPLPTDNKLSIDSINNLNSTYYLTLNTILIFPRQNIFGFDFAGTINNFGIWGEIAIFKPTKVYRMQTYLPDLSPYITLPFSNINVSLSDSLVLDNKPYAKYVVGTDYTFQNGIYFNFQYSHGFVHERGNGNLNDYFFIIIEKKLFNEKLKISPLNGGFVVSDWNKISDEYALIYMPQIEYYPTDNSSFTVGYRILDGYGNNSFALFKNYDEMYFRFLYSF